MYSLLRHLGLQLAAARAQNGQLKQGPAQLPHSSAKERSSTCRPSRQGSWLLTLLILL